MIILQLVYTTKTMTAIYTLTTGTVPLLISMPHNGELIPDDIAQTMTPSALKVPDTDWFMDKLYDFAQPLGAWVINPKYSRYVIDLNRSPTNENLYPGANSTELCPTTQFDLSPIYLPGKNPSEQEVARRINLYWQPYHQALNQTLTQMVQQFGYAILLEAHSILSTVPRFFDGQLPDFNFGTADGASCAEDLLAQVCALDFSPYSVVVNGRFKGGYITRAYGKPEQHIHAIQLELSQRTYLHEPSNRINQSAFNQVQPKLRQLVETLIQFSVQGNE
jgi:N-formylglutamate deformylase